MNNEISVKRAVLHVLDNNSGVLLLSKGELEITIELEEYLAKHIDKIVEDSGTKKAFFTGEQNNIQLLCKMLIENENDFLSVTTEITEKLYEIMQQHVDIPPADLICCLFDLNGEKHLGILKLNYKTGFTHWVQNEEQGNINTIIKHKTLLPQEGQKLEECVLISLLDYTIKILEKQFEINGEKEFYLSKLYLKSSCELSNKSKLKIIDKVAKEINKKYFDENFEKAIQIKKAVAESLEESSSIDIEQVAEKVFDKELTLRSEYVEEINKAGLVEKEITIPEKLIEKRYKTHKIKTDTGIEINFPIEYADNQDKIEFVNNPDGTISIIIRNIGKIENK